MAIDHSSSGIVREGASPDATSNRVYVVGALPPQPSRFLDVLNAPPRPARPSVLDLRAIGASADVAALARTRAVAVLCAVPPRGPLADEAEEALRAAGLDVAPVRVGHRAAFVHAATAGASVLEHAVGSRAADEVRALYAWVVEEMGRMEG